MRQSRSFLFVAAALAVGCQAHYNFARRADPNPFAGKTRFHIEPPDFSHATVEGLTLADWRAHEAQAQDWPLNSANAIREFFDQLQKKRGPPTLVTAGPPGPGDVEVVPVVESLVPGFYIGVADRPTSIYMRCKLLVNGTPADEVLFQIEVDATMFTPSFNQRLANGMRLLADQLAEFLAWRSASGN